MREGYHQQIFQKILLSLQRALKFRVRNDVTKIGRQFGDNFSLPLKKRETNETFNALKSISLVHILTLNVFQACESLLKTLLEQWLHEYEQFLLQTEFVDSRDL
jgi:hypothetical protein